ncbi:volume-regulated anion channel subunit LRRC8B-like [Oncorhynchus keta]|uniref:volume-regulated anion channel subunit LRRC8B-like n=1 Tax=Oncorhynchus keta TaxID=8018 RepID=UPI00227AC442|nr:volume-regulated anion channel subunit LRRC8B-like [Oncorhynchus keta]XP_035598450.2 volume-regulated anion channel subunit LRRC8B-like [Oncorhynchus keta]
MLSEGELKDFAQGQSLCRVLQPWWDVFSHYLSIMMFSIGTLGGTLQVTLRKIVCVPCQMTSDDFCVVFNLRGTTLRNATTEASFPLLPKGLYKLDLQQYAYVDAVCYEKQLHWFAKFFPYIVMLETLALVIISNLWFKYPSTSSRLMHFVSILHKCCDSPWTTRALSETVAEQVGAQPSMSMCSPALQASSTSDCRSRRPMGTEFLSVLDKKEGEQAKAIFEKVKKLKVHVEDKDIIYHLYMRQIVTKIVFLLFTLAYIPYAASHILFDVDCVVDSQAALMPFQPFHCVHSLATIFWLLSLVYTVLMVIYSLTCFYSFWWMMRNSLREYSFDSVREESSYSDIPDVKNDFAFILHLLDQYNPLFSKRFAVFLSEVSEKKLRQLNLNYMWPLEKLTQKVMRNAQDQIELHLMLLSGIPEAVFDIRELEVLKLQLIPDPRLTQKLTQLGNLREIWLDHSPATVDLMALGFLSENLRILRMKFTEVEQAPWWVFSLRNLTELYLYGDMFNRDTTFVNSLPKLKNLKVLFIKCTITAMPKAITNSIPSIQKLSVDNEGTQLSVLQSLKMMSQLTCLELPNCDLQRIPSPIFSLKNLQEIDLKGNNLKTIEEIVSFQHLPKLSVLKLKYNSITDIPVHVGVLGNLEQLHLGHNLISCMPPQLFLCSRLCLLDLSHNKLSAIPIEIQELKRLQLLNVSNNNIDHLPEGMFQCKTLQSLLLGHNNLSVVPQQVGELTNLVVLDLRGNQLESLPAELEECHSLMPSGLLVEEGLLNSLPPSVKEGFQGPDKEYLGKMEAEGVGNALTCNPIICNTAGHGDTACSVIYSM